MQIEKWTRVIFVEESINEFHMVSFFAAFKNKTQLFVFEIACSNSLRVALRVVQNINLDFVFCVMDSYCHS